MQLDQMVDANYKDKARLILDARVHALHAALKWAELNNASYGPTIKIQAEEYEQWLLRAP